MTVSSEAATASSCKLPRTPRQLSWDDEERDRQRGETTTKSTATQPRKRGLVGGDSILSALLVFPALSSLSYQRDIRPRQNTSSQDGISTPIPYCLPFPLVFLFSLKEGLITQHPPSPNTGNLIWHNTKPRIYDFRFPSVVLVSILLLSVMMLFSRSGLATILICQFHEECRNNITRSKRTALFL